jgi:hypothetical protein
LVTLDTLRALQENDHQHTDQHPEEGPCNEPYCKPTHRTVSLGLIHSQKSNMR